MSVLKRTRRSRGASVLFVVAVFLFILSFSISLPISIRYFYYLHIKALNLPQVSGFTSEQIWDAYNAVLDYLTLPDQPFSTGAFPYSEAGKAHFEDCKVLFSLDYGILMASGICLIVLLVLKRQGNWGAYRLAGRSSAFWGAVLAVTVPVCVGILAAVDFNRAFVVFHSVFFPGKTNWLFDWNADQIIRVLPQEFFRNCAILIGGSILVISLTLILWDLVTKGKRKA